MHGGSGLRIASDADCGYVVSSKGYSKGYRVYEVQGEEAYAEGFVFLGTDLADWIKKP